MEVTGDGMSGTETCLLVGHSQYLRKLEERQSMGQGTGWRLLHLTHALENIEKGRKKNQWPTDNKMWKKDDSLVACDGDPSCWEVGQTRTSTGTQQSDQVS